MKQSPQPTKPMLRGLSRAALDVACPIKVEKLPSRMRQEPTP